MNAFRSFHFKFVLHLNYSTNATVVVVVVTKAAVGHYPGIEEVVYFAKVFDQLSDKTASASVGVL